jgi:hypothetical protein
VSVVVIHTTESDPGSAQAVANYLRNAGKASNEVYDPSNDETVALIPVDQAALSLRNEPGGVQTNRRETDGIAGADVYQIEVVGRAADVAGYSEAWYQNLAKHVALVCWLTQTPLEFPCQFVAYPRPGYGKSSPYRMSFAQWNACRGVVGHQHVPENDHGDPGDISRMVTILSAVHPEVSMSNPVGTVDVWQPTGDGRIRVAGWSYDPDRPTESIPVHIHVWDSGHHEVTCLTTDVIRTDVNEARGITGAHGFEGYADLPKVWREPTVIAYGLDISGGENVEIGRNVVRIQA